MKTLILAVLLTTMQTSPPVPRQGANNPAAASSNGKSQSNTEKPPTPPSVLVNGKEEPRTAQRNSPKQSDKNTEHSVIIRELPPVTVTTPKRDWADWGYWVFSLLLAVVGALQVWLLARTLRAINRQAATMEKQTKALEESVKVAETSADAAKKSADIAACVSIPTLVIEKFEHGDTGAANLEAMLQYPKVKVMIKNYGQTPALLRSWTIVFTCDELPPVPDYPDHKDNPASGIVLERDVVQPNGSYTLPELHYWHRKEFSLEDVRAIINREKGLYAYGFICYYDLFGSPLRRFKFCEYALNFTDGHIQWVGGFSPEAYRGTDDFPLKNSAIEEKKAED
jgi:hypothetical protein